MSVANKIENYAEDAYNLSPQQFKEKPVYQAFLKTWADACQELEDVFYDQLFKQRLWANLYGDSLEKLANLFNISRTIGESDTELRRKIVGEIMKRASDGTPDKIREILSALIPIRGLKIFEHYIGGILIYGVADRGFELEGHEAEYLKNASPVTTGSTVLGFVETTADKLWIPSEISYKTQQLVVTAPEPNDTDLAPLFDWDLVAPDGGAGVDKIVVRDSLRVDVGTAATDISYIQAVLPEMRYRKERFQVDSQEGVTEAFSVDTKSGIEGFYSDVEGVDNSKGVCLEIVQRKIDSSKVEAFG